MHACRASFPKFIAIWLSCCVGALAQSKKGDSTSEKISHIPNVQSLEIYAPLPQYPPEAHQRHAYGDGYFVLHVDRSSGIVRSVEVRHSTGDRALDAAALKVLRHWRFKGGGVLSTSGPRNTKETKIGVPITFGNHPIA